MTEAVVPTTMAAAGGAPADPGAIRCGRDMCKKKFVRSRRRRPWRRGGAPGPAQKIGLEKILFIFLDTTCTDRKAIKMV
jgi:hypothetical protein